MFSAKEVPTQSGGDTASQTSIESNYYHRPFESLKHKVAKLCLELWPSKDIEFYIQQMNESPRSDIVGLKISLPSNQDVLSSKQNAPTQGKPKIPPGDYVLRIPHSKTNFQHEQDILELADSYLKRSGICVPLIVHFDAGEMNALNRPYCLQHRLQGSRLDLIWHTLNRLQREQIAFRMGRAFNALKSATNPSGGIPDLSYNRRQDEAIPTYSFQFPTDEAGTKHYFDSKSPQELVLEIIARLHQQEASFKSPWYRITEMMSRGCPDFNTPNSIYYFCHGNLFPRNIMVEIINDRIATVSGILGWESAHFAPAIISFAPPAWLWVKSYWHRGWGQNIEEEIWDVAAKDPLDLELRTIKSIFDHWLPVYVAEGAYGQNARLARKIWGFIREPRARLSVYVELTKIYQQWKTGAEK